MGCHDWLASSQEFFILFKGVKVYSMVDWSQFQSFDLSLLIIYGLVRASRVERMIKDVGTDWLIMLI